MPRAEPERTTWGLSALLSGGTDDVRRRSLSESVGSEMAQLGGQRYGPQRRSTQEEPQRCSAREKTQFFVPVTAEEIHRSNRMRNPLAPESSRASLSPSAPTHPHRLRAGGPRTIGCLLVALAVACGALALLAFPNLCRSVGLDCRRRPASPQPPPDYRPVAPPASDNQTGRVSGTCLPVPSLRTNHTTPRVPPNRLACADSGDFIADSRLWLKRLEFVQEICCNQMHEPCLHGPLPSQCASPACARSVALAATACAHLLDSSVYLAAQRDEMAATYDACQHQGGNNNATPTQPAAAVVVDPSLQYHSPADDARHRYRALDSCEGTLTGA